MCLIILKLTFTSVNCIVGEIDKPDDRTIYNKGKIKLILKKYKKNSKIDETKTNKIMHLIMVANLIE